MGNDHILPYCVYIERTQYDDVKRRPYGAHWDIVLFDPIFLYSGWVCDQHRVQAFVRAVHAAVWVHVDHSQSPFSKLLLSVLSA